MEMNYDVVVVTRNRSQALAMSLPLISRQTVKPHRIIIIDASDDPEPIKACVATSLDDTGIPYVFERSDQANLTRQRNLGLAHVISPIVIFPDDDSLWYHDTAEKILQIYKLDTSARIGAVSGIETAENPLEEKRLGYKKSAGERLRFSISLWRRAFENTFFPRPWDTFAWDKWKSQTPLEVDFLKSANAVLVENMTGFRMSFRTEALRKVGGFDENLGTVVGYSQFEDMEICMAIMDSGLLLAASHEAKICHHKFPGTRSRGYAYGFSQIFNMLYVVRKYSGEDSPQWRVCIRHIRFKLFMYLLAAKSAFGRERFKGAWDALKSRHALRGTTRDELARSFVTECRAKIEKANLRA